jgi:selenocysteine lyase/cysteine desulfurase
VRWAEVEKETGELPAQQYDQLLSGRTCLVAVTAASNVLGTKPDVPAITAKAHAAGALTYVDGVHATPHGPVDVSALGADFFATSAYKWSGPHVGAVVARPGLLAGLAPDKLASSPDTVPERYETGTPPYADFAGVVAAVDYLAELCPPGGATPPNPPAGASPRGATPPDPPAGASPRGATPPDPPAGASPAGAPASGPRRERILTSMAAAEAYEQRLFSVLLGGLGAMSHVTLYGKAAHRTATAYFTVSGLTPREVAVHLASRKINVWNGHNYAWELTAVLGIRDAGSAVRAGLVHYNDRSDVDRLLGAVAGLAHT